jgi:RNA polymerase sigma-70 factor (ECF subfamily)
MNGTVVIDRLDDAELVSRILAGETPLFESIVRRHQDRVYGIACRFLGRGAEAEDAAQEVFLRAYRGLEGFKGNAKLSTWLYRIAFNLCTDALRRRGSPVLRAETLDERAEIPDNRSCPEAAAVSSEEREAVARAGRRDRRGSGHSVQDRGNAAVQGAEGPAEKPGSRLRGARGEFQSAPRGHILET